MSKVRLTSGGRLAGADEQRHDVVDGDRLDLVVEPLRRDHRRQPGRRGSAACRRTPTRHRARRRPGAPRSARPSRAGCGRPRRVRRGAARAPRRPGAARRGRRCARRRPPSAASAKCVAASRSRSWKSGWSSIECTRYHAASTPLERSAHVVGGRRRRPRRPRPGRPTACRPSRRGAGSAPAPSSPRRAAAARPVRRRSRRRRSRGPARVASAGGGVGGGSHGDHLVELEGGWEEQEHPGRPHHVRDDRPEDAAGDASLQARSRGR